MIDLSGYNDFKIEHEGHHMMVYHAIREQDQKAVIVKILRSLKPQPDIIAQLYHEYEVMKSLHTPGVIKTYDLIHQNDHYAIIQEDINGIALADYIEKKQGLNLAEFYELALQMVDIIHEIHQQDIIHKDLKPRNFIINPSSGEMKLTDFGFAAKLKHEAQNAVPPSKLEGSLAYMSPEQTGRMNMNIDYRTDYYALGITFYQMLSNKLPFTFSDSLEMIHAHLAIPVPNLCELVPEVPETLRKIIEKLLAKNPSDRYQSSVGIKYDLEQCRDNSTSNLELGQRDIFDRLNLSDKLYGRDEEAKKLLAAYERTSNGKVEALLISGYSGVGKTSLVNEVHKPMVEHKGFFVSGKFDQLQSNTPYMAITQALNQLARLILGEPDERFEAIKKELQDALGNVGQVMINLAPDLELVIGKQPELEALSSKDAINRMMFFFKRFMKVIATKDHPIVIFIDDLQWADNGSLQLLEYIQTDDDLDYIMLIGAYRDNEVDKNHPLMHHIKNITYTGKKITHLKLEPLSINHIEMFFADSLNCKQEDIEPLAKLVYRQTNGNPFFCRQIFKKLYRDKLLKYDYKKNCWTWDIKKIKKLKAAENVIDLMTNKLQDLPSDTKNILKYAACIGNQFTLSTLDLVTNLPLPKITEALWPALEKEIIITKDQGYKNADAMIETNIAKKLAQKITYQFIHDKVQSVAYEALSDQEKQKTHIAIARLLIKKDPEISDRSKLFEITDHFNKAHNLLSKDEKLFVVELNYRSAIQSELSNAYQTMRKYLNVGLSLCEDSWWEDNYKTMFTINKSYVKSLYLTGDVRESFDYCEQLIPRAQNNYDKAQLVRQQCLQLNSLGQIKKGIDYGIKALSLLGVKVIRKPSKLKRLQKYLAISKKLNGKDIETLDQTLPKLQDPTVLLAFEVISELWIVYFFERRTGEYINLLAIDLLLSYGIPPSASYNITYYAGYILQEYKDKERAFQLWKLAENLITQTTHKSSASNAVAVMNTFLGCYFYLYPQLSKYAEQGYLLGFESGNLVFAAINLRIFSFFRYYTGESLNDIIDSANKALEFSKKINFQESIIACESQILIATTPPEKLENLSIYDGENSVWRATLVQQLAFFANLGGLFEFAMSLHQNWTADNNMPPNYHSLIHSNGSYIYTLHRLMSNASIVKRIRYFKKIRDLHKQIRWAASIAPDNFMHLAFMSSAIQKQHTGRYNSALRDYDQAIYYAKKHNYNAWLGLINELAAELCIAQSLDIASTEYIRQAHYYFGQFGYSPKCQYLEKQYPNVFFGHTSNKAGETPDSSQMQDLSISSSESLDFMSAIKASQAISDEIILEKLIAKMLDIALENAGAQRAVFITHEKDHWEACAELVEHDQTKNFIMHNLDLKEYKDIPTTMLQFVSRSKEPLVLYDASVDQQYINDPYIKLKKPKSVFCIPVKYHGEVLGMIYLENNLTVGAFTHDRIAVLTTLTAQVAISLENARHFEVMENLYRNTERFVPKQFLEILNRKNIEEIQLGDSLQRNISVLFTDVRGFTTLLETMEPKAAFELINRYWAAIAPLIRKNQGFIGHFLGDGLLALFPENPDSAVEASLEMVKVLSEFNSEQEKINGPKLDIGTGINTGSAMIGIVGELERIEPTVVSDSVNTASRIESLNKFYGTKVLTAESTIQSLKNKDKYKTRLIDRVQLKGRSTTTSLYEIIDWEEQLQDITLTEYLEIFTQGFADYQAGNFDSAQEKFNRCKQHNDNDKVVKILSKRCKSFITGGAPDEWDGTHRHEHK